MAARDFRAIKDRDVPIIGTGGVPMRAFPACVMAIVICQCEPTNHPMLIRGTDNIVGCPKCHKRYGIVSVQYDREAGDTAPSIEVGLLV